MTHDFDRQYWDDVWSGGEDDGRASAMTGSAPNPHLIREVSGLRPGSALEAGCGAGAEAIWLASQGWQVTAADIAAEALERAAVRAAGTDAGDRISWVQADLSTWEPGTRFDLVTTHYAHPAMPQLDFYERIADWVKPGGTLFIVGHLHREDHGHGHGRGRGHGHGHGHGHGDGHNHSRSGGHGHEGESTPPAEASASGAAIAERLTADRWVIATAEEGPREMRGPGGRAVTVHDVVVRATRRS